MNKEKLSDYEKALQVVSDLPHFHLGQEVETKHGIGIIVELEMEYNGLYISPERSNAVVWFSTEKASLYGTGWVNHSFRLSDLKVHNKVENAQ